MHPNNLVHGMVFQAIPTSLGYLGFSIMYRIINNSYRHPLKIIRRFWFLMITIVLSVHKLN